MIQRVRFHLPAVLRGGDLGGGRCPIRLLDSIKVVGRASSGGYIAKNRPAVPRCPFCRLDISEEDVLKIMDRPFRQREAVDDATDRGCLMRWKLQTVGATTEQNIAS